MFVHCAQRKVNLLDLSIYLSVAQTVALKITQKIIALEHLDFLILLEKVRVEILVP